MPLDPLEVLRAFESRDVVQQQRKLVMGREPNAEHSREIASHITQARQFLEAAEGAGDLVRPLIVYYGCLSLSRAVVMFRTNGRETTVSPKHGLTAHEWSKTLADGLGDFTNLQLKITHGTFRDLADAANNTEWVPYFTLPITYGRAEVGGAVQWPEDETLRLGSVWQRIPQLFPLLHATVGATTDAWPAFVVRNGPTHVNVELLEFNGRLPDAGMARHMMGMGDDVQATFVAGTASQWAMTQSPGTMTIRRALQVTVQCESADEFRHLLRRFRSDGNNVYVVEPPLPDLNLSTLSYLFAALYAAGSLVRYHPTTWQALARGGKGDRVLPILIKSIQLAESLFPKLALDAMMRRP